MEIDENCNTLYNFIFKILFCIDNNLCKNNIFKKLSLLKIVSFCIQYTPIVIYFIHVYI